MKRIERAAGFTLVELLVALALGAIISVVISFISSTARQAYTNTVTKVDVYNRFRLGFTTLQKDLSGWIPTQELEFYVDGRGGRPRDFHWQPGEQLGDRSDENGKGQVDGGVYGQYDEYPFIEQRQYISIENEAADEGDTDKKIHDAYRVYFRTMTYVDGAIREANVEYVLVDTSKPPETWENGVPPFPTDVPPHQVKDLALFKVVRYLKIDHDAITKMQKDPAVGRRILELATNVTDFRVEFLSQNPFSRPPRSGFRTPEADALKPYEPAIRAKLIKNEGQLPVFRKSFGYGSMDLQNRYPRGTAFTAVWGDDNLRNRVGHEPVRFGFQRDNTIQFAELGPGDRIYVFTDSTVGARAGGGGGVASLVRFPARDYTVKINRGGMLEFFEDIDASTWGDKDQRPVNYKAGWMPAALRITLRMVDDNGRNPKTMQQTIWLRRRSR
ncbi:MAG: prepilin-type N-terminal cleavage/methylation domain-containing protein [Planctomycetota bacterium]